MSGIQAQCWICPECHDDSHHQPGDKYCQAQKRNNEMAAHVERLREVLQATFIAMDDREPDNLNWERAREIYNEVPNQSLCEVRAQAVEQYGDHLEKYGLLNGAEPPKDYAQQIRSGKL